jgi:hypothetical protein
MNDELVARLGEINVKLGTLLNVLGRLLLGAVAVEDDGGAGSGEVRAFAHELVSLGGELTSLGVEMARETDEIN